MKLSSSLLCAALAFAISAPAAAEDAHGAVVAAFVEAFNRADRDTLGAYVQAHYSAAALAQRDADTRVDELLNLHQRLGAIRPIEVSGVTRLLILSAESSRQAQDADIVLLRDTDEPARLADVWAHPAAADLLTAEAQLR